MLFVVVFLAIIFVVPILTYVSYRADSAATKWGGIVAISLTFLVLGIFIPILWVGVILGPLLWLLTSVKDTSVRWDKMNRKRGEPQAPTAEQVERAQARVAKGECPACGARNKAGQQRCRVCGSFMQSV